MLGLDWIFCSNVWFSLNVQFGIYVRSSSNAWFRFDIQFKCLFLLECSVCYNLWISLKIQFDWKILGSDLTYGSNAWFSSNVQPWLGLTWFSLTRCGSTLFGLT